MKVTTLKKEIPAALLISDYVDVERFDECCRACRNYGRTWACPPYGFDREELLGGFSSFLLYAKKAVLSDEERAGTYSGKELARAYERLLAPVRAELTEELLALEAAEPGSLALFSGGCDICRECARGRGEPCAFPERMRYSVESLGGDVIKCLRDFFCEEVEWAENGRLPEKYILLGGLLKRRQSALNLIDS